MRMLYSMSIRHSHSANAHRLDRLVGRMPDLKLPLLAHLKAASKQAEDFIRQVGQCWREDSRWIVRLLTVRLGWTE